MSNIRTKRFHVCTASTASTGHCSDGVSQDRATCEQQPHRWVAARCSDALSAEQGACEALQHTWVAAQCSEAGLTSAEQCTAQASHPGVVAAVRRSFNAAVIDDGDFELPNEQFSVRLFDRRFEGRTGVYSLDKPDPQRIDTVVVTILDDADLGTVSFAHGDYSVPESVSVAAPPGCEGVLCVRSARWAHPLTLTRTGHSQRLEVYFETTDLACIHMGLLSS